MPAMPQAGLLVAPRPPVLEIQDILVVTVGLVEAGQQAVEAVEAVLALLATVAMVAMVQRGQQGAPGVQARLNMGAMVEQGPTA